MGSIWSQPPEYLHVLLNHLPVVGMATALLAAGIALFSKNSKAIALSLLLVGLFAASVWPVIETGEAAYNRIRTISDPDGATLLKQHMLLADRWAWVYYLTAIMAVVATGLVWKMPKWQNWAVLAVALSASASLIAGVAIAKLGGQVRHPEFRPGSTLVPEAIPAEHNHSHDHGDPPL